MIAGSISPSGRASSRPEVAISSRRSSNLLLASGDVAVAQGRATIFGETLRHLSPHWERIDVLCPRAPGTEPRALHGNVFVRPSPWPRALQAAFVARAALALARERRYALLVSHDYGVFSNGLACAFLARRLRVPWVSELHHVEGYPRAASARERAQRRLTFAYVRFARPRVAAFRTVNRREVPGLLRRLGVPQERILVLPSLYLDLDVLRPLPEEPKRYDVLFVGRLVPNKRVDLLLDALGALARERPQLRACLVGEGPLRGEVERRVAAPDLRGRVELVPRVGSLPELARVYNAARVLVCVSSAEGGPRVTAEAMACGTPVVSTPVGIMPELLAGGENGLLVGWDAAEVASRIALLLDDEELRLRLGEAGRRAVQEFRAEEVVGRLARAYRDLAARP